MILTHTISLVEVLWTIVCSLGLYYCGRLLFRAMGDVQWLRENDVNGARRHAAISSVLVYLTMTFTQFGYTIIGIIAMTLPSANNTVQPLSYVITAVFIMASSFKTVVGFMLNRRKEELFEMLQKERDDEDVLLA